MFISSSFQLRLTIMSPSDWYKCAHTCVHVADPLRSRTQNARLTYEFQGMQIAVGTVPVWHRNSTFWRRHVASTKQHPACTPSCPMHEHLGKKDKANLWPDIAQLRLPLSHHECAQWSLAIALTNMTGQYGDSVPDSWRTKAGAFLEECEAVSNQNGDDELPRSTDHCDQGPTVCLVTPNPDPQAQAENASPPPVGIETSQQVPLFPKPQPLDTDEPPICVVWIESRPHAVLDYTDACQLICYHNSMIRLRLALEVQEAFPNNLWILDGQGGKLSKDQIEKTPMEENVEVIMEEWVTILVKLMERDTLFDVKLMTFQNFFQALTTPSSNPNLVTLEGADLILAWGDLSMDFLGPNNCYGWNTESFNIFFQRLLQLSHVTAIWPHPAETLIYGNKTSYLSDAAAIARQHGHEIPAVCIIDHPQDVKELQPDLIYKRGYSDFSQHVYFSGCPNLGQKPMGTIEAFLAAVDEGEHCYAGVDGGLGPITPKWFTMPYLDSVKKFGELHVFFVSGKITHTTATMGIRTTHFRDVRNPTLLDKLL
ncbi:hypothetical protein H2248_002575 [Termitomyces sp. 'cryptogamus']|nr:hypothetical protein H2248_002575 [Termitomyces sp. 'cryptogamus']